MLFQVKPMSATVFNKCFLTRYLIRLSRH